MSNGFAVSSLYAICRGSEQKKELIKRFEKESPGNGLFQILDAKNHISRVEFEFQNSEVRSSLDDDILELATWLKNSFRLKLQGFWRLKNDGEYRGEVRDGAIGYADLTWLCRHTVAHIEKLRKIAEERFRTDYNEG